MHQLELTLTAAATAPGAAREAVRAWLHRRRCDEEVVDTAALLVTELVTNAVVHATGPGLCLTVDEESTDVMHVAVRDGSRATPQRQQRAPGMDETDGRGLFLIEEMATGWGWEPLRTGKRVWFELLCAPRSRVEAGSR